MKNVVLCPGTKSFTMKATNRKGGITLINQVTLLGRLTRHPELKYGKDGTPFLHMTVAVNRSYSNAKGEYEADFIFCSIWGKLAEKTAQRSEKGGLVAIVGTLQSRKYQNESGSTVFVTEVLVQTIRPLTKKQSAPPVEAETVPLL